MDQSALYVIGFLLLVLVLILARYIEYLKHRPKRIFVISVPNAINDTAHKNIEAEWKRCFGPDAPPVFIVDAGANVRDYQ